MWTSSVVRFCSSSSFLSCSSSCAPTCPGALHDGRLVQARTHHQAVDRRPCRVSRRTGAHKCCNRREVPGKASIWAIVNGVEAPIYGAQFDVHKRKADAFIESRHGSTLEIGISFKGGVTQISKSVALMIDGHWYVLLACESFQLRGVDAGVLHIGSADGPRRAIFLKYSPATTSMSLM